MRAGDTALNLTNKNGGHHSKNGDKTYGGGHLKRHKKKCWAQKYGGTHNGRQGKRHEQVK